MLKTKLTIQVLSITYFTGILFFQVLYLRKVEYSYLLLFLPLFGYLWIVTFGARYVNNYYGFKHISGETMIYVKKPKAGYTIYVYVFIIIFLFSSLIRLISEIRNLVLLKRAM